MYNKNMYDKEKRHQEFLRNREKYRQRSHEYYLKNRKRIDELAKIWAKNNPEKRKMIDKKYAKNHREKIRLKQRRYMKTNPLFRIKNSARVSVQKALKSGKLIRPSLCSLCSSTFRIEAHHYLGYSKEHRLDVQWVCKSCHLKIEPHRPAPAPAA